MAKLINCSLEDFNRNNRHSNIVLLGAGRKFEQILNDKLINGNIIMVSDNDSTKWGRIVTINEKKIAVHSIKQMVDEFEKEWIIVITGAYAISQIMEQLNSFSKLKNVRCYSLALMQDCCSFEKIIYTEGEKIIPKKIHYCWFGRKEMPTLVNECIESWKKMCPDYDIIRWDETNYNYLKNTYIKQAYEHEYWSFVTDYVRLDVVYNYGGIYLDTDVKMLKRLDDLLCDKSFWGFMNYSAPATGLGFGAIKQNDLVGQCLDYYNDKIFVGENEKYDFRTCIDHQLGIFKNYGFIMNNKQQNINGNVLYPMEVFNPRGNIGVTKLFSIHTHSEHMGMRSWEKEKNKSAIKYNENNIMRYIEREE